MFNVSITDPLLELCFRCSNFRHSRLLDEALWMRIIVENGGCAKQKGDNCIIRGFGKTELFIRPIKVASSPSASSEVMSCRAGQ